MEEPRGHFRDPHRRSPLSLTSIIAGRPVVVSGSVFESTDPWTDTAVAFAAQADAAAEAAHAAEDAFARVSWTSSAAILERASDIVGRRLEDLATMMVREADAIRFFTQSQTIYWKSGAVDAEFP